MLQNSLFFSFRHRIKNANSNVNYKEFNSYFGNEEDIPLEKNYPKENTIEAEIQDGDTLQKIALRFNCTVIIYCTVGFLQENLSISFFKKI